MTLSNKTSPKQIQAKLTKFTSARVAVVGDLMLDTFTYGVIERMSPEAPVPIVHIQNEYQMLGGAGNVAMNARLLGGEVCLFGRIGDDAEGRTILSLINEAGIKCNGVVIEFNGYPTTEKRRVIAAEEHRIRIDKELIRDLSEQQESELLDLLAGEIKNFNVIVIGDYAKGCITETGSKKILALAKKNNIPVIVDTKPGRQGWFKNVTLMTPNALETKLMTGESDTRMGGKKLLEATESAILVTEGPLGMTFFDKNSKPKHLPVTGTSVIDVSGAGDTVVACIAVSLACGNSLFDSIYLSNFAAGIAVSKPGTAAVHLKDLQKKLAK